MEKIARVHADNYLVLRLFYQYESIEVVADLMKCGLSKARERRNAAFDMVVILLMD